MEYRGARVILKFQRVGNLVNTIDEADDADTSNRCKLFIFTDNIAAEGAYFKVTLPSHHLFELLV